MGFTLIDYFNGFQSLKNSRHFSAGVQATYYAILAEFNRQRYPEQLELSTRDLQRLAGLKSVSSTHEARNILKNNKLIDFHTKSYTTLYQLGTEHLQNTSRTPAEHLPNSCRTLSYSNSLPSSPLKEKEKEKKEFKQIQSRARSIESNLSSNSKGTEKEESDSIDELIEYWEKAGGSKLNFVIISELKALLEENSLVLLKKAIDEACMGNNSRYGFSLNYMKLKLADIQKAVPAMKGGESSGRYQESKDPRATWAYSNS